MTAQIAEKLIYNGKDLPLYSNPLSSYLAQNGIKFQSTNTANWRGYRGTWEVKGAENGEQRLYLIGLTAHKSYEEIISIKDIFPGFPKGVFAHWFSGTLRCPQGKQIEYVHMGYGSTYEYEIFLEFKRGILVNKLFEHNSPKENKNSKNQDIPSFLRKQSD